MPTIADIILNDGAATPVPHTFKVKSNDAGVSIFQDRAAGIPVAYGVVKIRTEDTANVRKINLEVSVPTLEAVSGSNNAGFTPAATVAYVTRAKMEFFLPQRGNSQERKNVLAYVKNLLGDSAVNGVITSGDEFTG